MPPVNKCNFTPNHSKQHLFESVSLLASDGTLSKLADAATQQVFKPWELADNKFRIELDLASVEPQVTDPLLNTFKGSLLCLLFM